MTESMTTAAAHSALIKRFYTAFSERDGHTMGACYHPSARFSDPAFPDLRGPEVSAMWRMLTQRAKDLTLSFDDIEVTAEHGTAKWIAQYTFSATARKVENHVRAAFVFKDGLIIEHADLFDFWRWSKQALGPMGYLLGWSGFLRRKVQAQARSNLTAFMAKEAKS